MDILIACTSVKDPATHDVWSFQPDEVWSVAMEL